MRIQALTGREVLERLITSGRGLSDAEAAKRLAEYGANEIKAVRGRPLYRRLLSQFTHFLAILLWIAAALCFLSEYLNPGEGMLSLGVAVIAVILINALFTFVQEYRAERALEALRKLLPFNVRVLRDGVTREVPGREVVPGDVTVLNEGDRVPADCRLIESVRLVVNNAPLTGESDAKPRGHEPFSGDYLESPNIVFAGTLVLSGSGKAVAFATGMATEFGKIAHLTSGVDPEPSPLQKEIVKVTRIIAVIALTTGVLFFSLGFLIGRSFWHNLLFAIGITIANVPEGLLPTVTLSLAMGSQRMAKRKALVKNLASVETLGSVTVICTDKTGTLTVNRMEVREVWVPGGGGVTDDSGRDRSRQPDLEGRRMLLTTAALCNNAAYADGRYHGDPTETALLEEARDQLGDLSSSRIFEIPFDSERKMMTVLSEVEQLRFVLTKGALERVLPLCTKILVGGEARELGQGREEEVREAYHRMTDRGLRVMAFAHRRTEATEPAPGPDVAGEFERDLVFTGLMGLEDPPRPEVPEAVERCREAGIRIIMITGDAGRTAVAVGRQVGLVAGVPAVVSGQELDAMDDAALRGMLSSGEIIFSRMTPRHKMRIVAALKEEGERVAVTGDGVNDAPALRKADIGIAMGKAGTDVAKEAADVVLLDDNFATIVNAVEEGRAIFENIRKFITYIFAHGTPEAVPYVLFALANIPLPLTVMQILAIDLGTETIPALALGVERPEADIMKRPPRPRERGLIDRGVLFRGYVFIGFISTIGVLAGYFYVLFQGGWTWGANLPGQADLARQATTATFLGIVILQIGNVFVCRSATNSIFRLGFLSNRLVLAGIAFELLLSAFIIYHPLGHAVFGTAPLGLDVWLVLMPFSAALLAAEEVRKRYAGGVAEPGPQRL